MVCDGILAEGTASGREGPEARRGPGRLPCGPAACLVPLPPLAAIVWGFLLTVVSGGASDDPTALAAAHALFSQTIQGLWTCDTLVFTVCADQPLLLRGAMVTCQADADSTRLPRHAPWAVCLPPLCSASACPLPGVCWATGALGRDTPPRIRPPSGSSPRLRLPSCRPALCRPAVRRAV